MAPRGNPANAVARHAGRFRRKLPHTTHLHDISHSVTILRERHPFEGRSLIVMSTVKRRDMLLLLVVLPDGSRSLIPAGWTDWTQTAEDDSLSRSEHHDCCLASLADLLHARGIVDALLGRCLIPQQMPAANEESCDATDPGLSRTTNADTVTAAPGAAQRRSTRRGARHSRTPHCASRSASHPGGGNR